MSSYISIPYIANKLLTVAMYKLRYKISIFKSVAKCKHKRLLLCKIFTFYMWLGQGKLTMSAQNLKSILLLNITATLQLCSDTVITLLQMAMSAFPDGLLPTLSSHEWPKQTHWYCWGALIRQHVVSNCWKFSHSSCYGPGRQWAFLSPTGITAWSFVSGGCLNSPAHPLHPPHPPPTHPPLIHVITDIPGTFKSVWKPAYSANSYACYYTLIAIALL